MANNPLNPQEMSDRLRARGRVGDVRFAITARPSTAVAQLRASARREFTAMLDAVEPDQDALEVRRDRERAERKRAQREQGDAYQPRRKKSRGNAPDDPIDLTAGSRAAPHHARRALERASGSDTQSDAASSVRSRSRSQGATSSDSSARPARARRSRKARSSTTRGGSAAGSAGPPPFMTPALQAAIDEARRQAADAERAASAPADDAPAVAAAAAPAKQFAMHTRKRSRSLAQSLAPAALAPEHTPAARLAVFEAMCNTG